MINKTIMELHIYFTKATIVTLCNMKDCFINLEGVLGVNN